MNKNILIVTSEFPPLPGGIGNHAYCLAKELACLNYSVTVLTEERAAGQADWQKFVKSNKDINIVGIKRNRFIIFTYILRVLRLYELLRRASRQAVFYSGKFSVWLNGIMPKTKSVIIIHGSEIKQKGILRVLFKRGLKRAEYIVCVSDYTKNQLVDNYQNLDTKKIIVINNGFQSKIFSDQARKRCFEESRLNLVTVGGIHKRKGQFNVVKALPEIIKVFPETKYNVIGLPLEKDELVTLINNNNVSRNVAFYHGLNDCQVAEMLNESDIFMMLSEHLENGDFEGFGIAILEAMALGLPAVGTRNSGISDAIKDGYCGKLVDPKDADQIINALKEIRSNYSCYSTKAKQWAESFRWSKKVPEYQALIDKL